MFNKLVTWATRIARRSRHVKPTFYRSRHRAAWNEVTTARQEAYDRLVTSLEVLFVLEAAR